MFMERSREVGGLARRGETTQTSQRVHQISPRLLERKLPGLLMTLAVTTSWQKCTFSTETHTEPSLASCQAQGRLDKPGAPASEGLDPGHGAWYSGLVCRTDGEGGLSTSVNVEVGGHPRPGVRPGGVTHSRTGWPLQAGGPGPLCGGLPVAF